MLRQAGVAVPAALAALRFSQRVPPEADAGNPLVPESYETLQMGAQACLALQSIALQKQPGAVAALVRYNVLGAVLDHAANAASVPDPAAGGAPRPGPRPPSAWEKWQISVVRAACHTLDATLRWPAFLRSCSSEHLARMDSLCIASWQLAAAQPEQQRQLQLQTWQELELCLRKVARAVADARVLLGSPRELVDSPAAAAAAPAARQPPPHGVAQPSAAAVAAADQAMADLLKVRRHCMPYFLLRNAVASPSSTGT